jgi:hypothetical protein
LGDNLICAIVRRNETTGVEVLTAMVMKNYILNEKVFEPMLDLKLISPHRYT